MPYERPELPARGHYPRTFKEWGISVTLVRAGDSGAVYFPVRQVCEGLGIDADKQLRTLSAAHAGNVGALAEIRLPTAGGMQKAVCLRQKETAWWLINLDDARCKPAIRGHLQAIKQQMIAAADAILFGDIDREGEGERGLLASSSRQEFVLACLDCGARHRVIFVNGEATVTLERED